jgi:stress-induced-phosphoprotein 1
MEFQRAKEHYEIALKKDPNFLKAYHKKGDCHYFLKEYHKALSSYEAGLKLDPNDNFCKEGIEKTQQAIYLTNSQEDQEVRAKRAMADPEIQAILQTPEVRNALSELERDPKSINHILQNKSIAEKLEKLIAAGVLRMG